MPLNCPQVVCNPTANPANNRLDGYTYDASGNTKIDASGRGFSYDAENKQTEVKDGNNIVVGRYYYDGDGKRVKKVSNTETVIFVYDASGKLIAEYSNQTNATPQISYLTNDHLGSPRIITDGSGNVTSRRDFQPFGEEVRTWYRVPNLGYAVDDDVRQKFTGYERDNESELDFAQARYYNKQHGRFTSSDKPFLDQVSSKPQSWNLFTYVTNNPLKFVDPLGLWKKVACSSGGENEECWEAEEGDTYETLADERCQSWLGCNSVAITEFFGSKSIAEGEVFSLGGFDEFRRSRMDELVEIVPGPLGGGGMKPGGAGKVGKGVVPSLWQKIKNIPGWVKDKVRKPPVPTLRQNYEDEVKGLATLVDEMYKSGHTMEQIAIKVHAARRNLGVQYKDLTPPELLRTITQRNISKYGDPLGPSIEWLRSRGKSWEDIIESAVRPGGKDINFNQ